MIRFSVGVAALGATLLVSGAVAPRTAQAQVFDFEDQAATFTSPPATNRTGAFTSLALVNNGLTLTITRPNNAGFDIVDNTADNQNEKPAAFGTRSLDPFFDTSGNDPAGTGQNGFIGDFSSSVNAVSLDFGDYGGDSDTLTLSAFSGANGTGTLLSTTTINLGTTDFRTSTAQFPAGFGTASVFASGIQSVTISGTSDAAGFNNSVFIDNIRVNASVAAPEPGSLALLLGAGSPLLAGGMAFGLRRRKK